MFAYGNQSVLKVGILDVSLTNRAKSANIMFLTEKSCASKCLNETISSLKPEMRFWVHKGKRNFRTLSCKKLEGQQYVTMGDFTHPRYNLACNQAVHWLTPGPPNTCV